MSNRTDAQDGIDFQKNKQGVPDSISPTNQAEKTFQPILDGAVMADELPYTVTPELVTFDRDVQIPQNSLFVGDAIKMSDLAQSIGYETAFDGKQYILMGYEITSDESKKPVVKDFSEGSSFVLQPVEDTTQTFTNTLEVLIPAVQQVIGKTYSLKAVCDEDLLVQVFRLADTGGVDTLIVNEELAASITNINGFNFDLVPLVDFELGKNYRIELTPLNGGTLEIKGGLLSGVFVPYIERVLGWEYINKEIAFTDDLPKLYAHKGITVADPPFENNTSIPVLVDTWTLNVPEDGTYSISVTVEYNINNVQRDAIFRFDLNGATGININQESKDSTNKIFFTTFAIDDLTAGNNVIQFYASIENPQNAGQRIQVVSNRFTAQKVDELS
jgi:hypothetical protein